MPTDPKRDPRVQPAGIVYASAIYDHLAALAAEAERGREATALILEIAASEPESDLPGLRYVTVQIDRKDWERSKAIRAAIQEGRNAG